MYERLSSHLAVWLIVAGAGTVAWAELESVSRINNTEILAGGNPAEMELFPAGGLGTDFPLWYKDTRGFRLTLCLAGEEEEPSCAWEDSPVFTDPNCNDVLYEYRDEVGFGDEAFYYKVQSYPFDLPLDIGGFAQLQYLVESTWGEDERFDEETGELNGQAIFIEDEDGACVSAVGADLHRVEPGFELLFSRVRLRLLVNAPAGWYRITHPYGVKTMFRERADFIGTRRTMARQVIGDLLVPDEGWGVDTRLPNFLISLNDPYVLIDETNPDPFNHPFIGLQEGTGFTNDGDFTDAVERLNLKSVGPFLHKPDYLTDPDLSIEDDHGVVQQYIGRAPNEDDPEASPGHPVVGSQFIDPLFPQEGLANFVRVRFLAGASGSPPSDADCSTFRVSGDSTPISPPAELGARGGLAPGTAPYQPRGQS
jgi:hypothetical protein